MWSSIPEVYLIPILVAAVVYYLYVVSTVQTGKKRIQDLAVVAIILWLSPVISSAMKINALSAAGFLVFVYGWAILIIKKFQEGLHDNSHD